MKFFPALEKTDILLVLFGLTFIVFGWFTLSLALGSLFLLPLLALGFFLTLAVSAFLTWKLLSRAPSDMRIAFAASFIAALVFCFFSTPTLFSGRDQGSIAEAAYRLAKNGELPFSTPASEAFFEIYGEGTALNFPGFAYTEAGDLITQFPLAYTSFIASFVSFFGLFGYAIANAILVFLFFLFSYALLRQFVESKLAWMGFFLLFFSFLPAWFSKFTLTENLASFLFVFLALNVILFLREGKFPYYAGILLSGGLFAFTRIEGFVILGIALFLLLFSKNTYALWKTYPFKSLLLPGVVFLFYFLRDFFLNLPYYKMIGKAAFKFANGFGSDIVVGSPNEALFGGHFALGSIFLLYGLLPVFVLGFLGILLTLREKRFLPLVPLFLGLPTLAYLFSPNITLDHPWMLRRYYFAVFPVLLFFAVLALGFLTDKSKNFPLAAPKGKRLMLAVILFLGLLSLSLPAWISGVTFAENRTLLEQVENFTAPFQENDLVLVDRFATGNGFAMLTGPGSFLFHKNTVYFFNPEDLEKIDRSRFSGIYLLVPEESIDRYSEIYGERMIFRENVVFSSAQFENLSLEGNRSFRLPKKERVEVRNILFQIY